MSAAVVERDLGLDPVLLRSLQQPRSLPAPVRPGRHNGRSVGPRLRPVKPVESPALRRPRSTVQSCSVDLPPAATAASTRASVWRLTDRGIAVVLVVGAMIAFTALTVVGLTAFRVTSERYQSSSVVLTES